LTRGGARRNAGRPRKTSELKPAIYYGGKKRAEEGVNPYELLSKLRELRKQGNAGKALVETGLSTQAIGSGYNYTIQRELYSDWPLARSAIDWAIDTALENGYRTESKNAEAKMLCDGWAKLIHLDDEVLPRWILSWHTDGDIFEERVWGSADIPTGTGGQTKPYKVPTTIKPLDAQYMQYTRDPDGGNLQWGQYINGQMRAGPWKPDDVSFSHYAWRAVGSSLFGTPIVASIIEDVTLLLALEKDWGEIVEWYIKPLWLILVGTPDKPASDTLLSTFKTNWENRLPNTDLIAPGNVKIEEHGAGKNQLDMAPFLKYHNDKMVDGLESPLTHSLQSANQASASEIRSNAFSRIGLLQRIIKRKLEEIFTQILTQNNIQDEVKITFQPLREMVLVDRVDRLIKLLDPIHVSLSDQTRMEAEQQLRMVFLDLTRDDTLKPSVSPMPGQQGLFSRVFGARQPAAQKEQSTQPANTSTT
jgi:hypothetical protein